jgi:cellulose biosynthesis protein BcsQ
MIFQHLQDFWDLMGRTGSEIANKNPHLNVYFYRNGPGKGCLLIENQSTVEFDASNITLEINLNYLIFKTPILDFSSPLIKDGLRSLIKINRRKFNENISNFFIVDRLFQNESWITQKSIFEANLAPIVAFYSFKGGVGRSTAAALTALSLARKGKRIALLDFDFEAPGIESLFPDIDSHPSYGIVDFLLEQEIHNEVFTAESQRRITDYSIPVSDKWITDAGGALFVIPAGDLSADYIEKIGRLNLIGIDIHDQNNPIRQFIANLNTEIKPDIIMIDCRTGFSDIGGITLNGLSDLDVLLFRGSQKELEFLPLVLKQLKSTRPILDYSETSFVKASNAILIAVGLLDPPSDLTEANQHSAQIRSFISNSLWENIFKPFGNNPDFTYPSDDATDTPFDPVPHDFVEIPYIKNFQFTKNIDGLWDIQKDHGSPYDELSSRILGVKLQARLRNASQPHPKTSVLPPNPTLLEDVKKLGSRLGGETDFTQASDFKEKFLPRASHRVLLDPKAFLVLGRKGAGKSALFNLLKQPDYLKSLSNKVGLDSSIIDKTIWLVAFDNKSREAGTQYFNNMYEIHRERPDSLDSLWFHHAAKVINLNNIYPDIEFDKGKPLPSFSPTPELAEKLEDYLVSINSRLETDDKYISLSYDDIDTGLTRSIGARKQLVSSLLEFWQRSIRRYPRIRPKIFLREDIYNFEVQFTDKSKIREGIDRTTITWSSTEIYRLIIKRLLQYESFIDYLKNKQLMTKIIEESKDSDLGYTPDEDPDWIQRVIETMIGETMASGEFGYKKGYVYTWIPKHLADAASNINPRNALVLFSEAAKIQRELPTDGSILRPQSINLALRTETSRVATEDLREEFKQEWEFGDAWIPDSFKELSKIWPISEDFLDTFLSSKLDGSSKKVKEILESMMSAGLLSKQKFKKEVFCYIPDIYLFGLGLTRRG